MTHPTVDLRRVVSRWQIVGLALNDVIGSGARLASQARCNRKYRPATWRADYPDRRDLAHPRSGFERHRLEHDRSQSGPRCRSRALPATAPLNQVDGRTRTLPQNEGRRRIRNRGTDPYATRPRAALQLTAPTKPPHYPKIPTSTETARPFAPTPRGRHTSVPPGRNSSPASPCGRSPD